MYSVKRDKFSRDINWQELKISYSARNFSEQTLAP